MNNIEKENLESLTQHPDMNEAVWSGYIKPIDERRKMSADERIEAVEIHQIEMYDRMSNYKRGHDDLKAWMQQREERCTAYMIVSFIVFVLFILATIHFETNSREQIERVKKIEQELVENGYAHYEMIPNKDKIIIDKKEGTK